MNLQKRLPNISIVIPCFLKSNKHLSMSCRCIDTIKKCTTLPYDLIIVENSDEPLLEDECDTHIYSNKFKSFAVNVNEGLHKSKSDYTVLVSNDIFVEDGWLEGMLKCFEDSKCGVSYPLSRQFNIDREDKIEPWFFGAIWMVSKEAIAKVGYLDERFINSFEDSDYWIRMMMSGYSLLLNRNVLVEHLVGATAYGIDSHTENYKKNQKLFIEKHKDCGLDIYQDLK